MRVVGIDLGTRRIGVAVSDSGRTVATPHTVIDRSGDDRADWAAIGAVVRNLGAELLVVGLPLSLDGSRGPAATRAEGEAIALEAATGIPVELHDERLTTVAATRAPRQQSRKGKRRIVDDAAASLILQSWLDVNGVRKVP
ncbi:MAG TPA: Holliday junction resolvase RuvX [Acidimicrobiales bacterium]|nr:Holliday junction resolvase RuvX [Acidimicrobiales bacterium]